MMKLCVLASGSSGNCIFVASDTTRILIDAGLSGRETDRRLSAIGVSTNDIQAVCLTHEHADHISGLRVLQSRHGLKLYANAGTVDAVSKDAKMADVKWQVFTTGSAFQIGDLTLEPFAVSHDAFEPVGFVISGPQGRVGVVTDIGVSTHLVRERLKRCQVLVVEANHDEKLLHAADRPWSLKQRIAGRQGHLSNIHAGEMIAEAAGTELADVFLAHLSSDCNRPELAVGTVSHVLTQKNLSHIRVRLTYPDRVSEVWCLTP